MSNNGKDCITAYLDGIRNEIVALSHNIHDNPELAFEEYKARDWQIEMLERHGFTVETPFSGMDTAFKASVKTGEGPRIAFLSEYDALPNGHACGHNLMAASAVGAGVGLARILRDTGTPGEVLVIGTPGEEMKGGKVFMVDLGAFDSVDFALMMHPGTKNLVSRGGLAALPVTVRYYGKGVHSAQPEKGINALTSLIALFNSIDMLRQVWPDKGRCNGIISAGGTAHNIVPDFAEGQFSLRAEKKKELVEMMAAVRVAAEGAAKLTGARLEIIEEALYAERYPNAVMGELFKANMESLGEEMHYPDPDKRVGSSDFGNVSMVVPAIHEYLGIAPESVAGHTDAFREASRSQRGDDVAVLAAKGLAMTGWDLAVSAEARAAARKEFEEKAMPNRC